MMQPLDIASLTTAYASGAITVEQVFNDIFRRIATMGELPVWIDLTTADQVAAKLANSRRRMAAGETLPLFGIPFAVKDNIDVAGLPTTAACPEFAYMPERSATSVEKLEAAGAIVVGKTNLDQFATGLVGTRSPYGIPRSVFNPAYISGGSSSGSAVAVAAGLVSFSLGTDTAGSGRVAGGVQQYRRAEADQGAGQHPRGRSGLPQPRLRFDLRRHGGRGVAGSGHRAGFRCR